MTNYTNEIKYAVEAALATIWADVGELEILRRQLDQLTAETESGYRRAQAFQYDEDPDDVMMGVGIHWATYFGPDKERHEVATNVNDLNQRIQVREFSRSAMSASVLQYAKQGISIVHAGLQPCPNGRGVGSQSLKNIIWQGRNQSLHWEEGNPRQPVIDCFDQLAIDFGDEFTHYNTSNLAFNVVRTLNWREFESFETDMQSLA
ncbi:hypothetical protein [Wenzhouxiangella marina]|nr:hypothetical protein [Wenzhouxiangella marina]MBB6087959.1 hypothetical protein [Wenzhouxiangella marina]